jgi:hypothetical protein
MDSRERYQRRAIDLLQATERLHDPAERKKLLEIALSYSALARYVAERREDGTAHRPAQLDAARHPDDA